MSSDHGRSGFKLTDVDDPGVLEALARVDARPSRETAASHWR
jgi:hypothetical protein